MDRVIRKCPKKHHLYQSRTEQQCLGHQLLCMAIGSFSFKMKYGNRSRNQLCIHHDTGRCYMTSQNHGFATDAKTPPINWESLFTNANDKTNEGIIHSRLPTIFQCTVPSRTHSWTTEVLFDVFLGMVKNYADHQTNVKELLTSTLKYSKQPSAAHVPKKLLIIGSHGLSIGQAGEFDYSGSQAIKALRRENIQMVLINPNIATVQTLKGLADKIYFLPLVPEYVEQVIRSEKPGGVLLNFGEQTGLNCGVELERLGVFKRYKCQILGTSIQAIIDTEDRKVFIERISEKGEKVVPSMTTHSVQEALEAADQLGYPVMARAAFSS